MSAATTEGRLVGSGLPALPQVNLLPPETAERRRFRQIQYGLGGGLLATVAVVFLLFVLASNSVGDAQKQVDASQSRNTQLQTESAKYADVTAVYAKAAAAQAMLTQAMGQEVRYSQLLNDLSLSVPDKVWVKNVAFAQAAPAAAAGAAVPAGDPGLGTLTVTGVGFSHDDVAVWLDSLATQKNYSNPDFSSSTEALLGSRKVVNFTSTATVTSRALSGRYTSPAGG